MCEVTPLAGVWVEIGVWLRVTNSTRVTPLAGVWVEIAAWLFSGICGTGHSPFGSVG